MQLHEETLSCVAFEVFGIPLITETTCVCSLTCTKGFDRYEPFKKHGVSVNCST